MGNKESSDAHLQVEESEAERTQGDGYADPIKIQVQEYLKGLDEFSPIIKHTELLGGMIRRRSMQQDTVDSMDHETVLKLWQAVHGYTKPKTKRALETQAKLKKQVKSVHESCEQAAAALYFASTNLMKQCGVLHETRPMTGEIQKACDSVNICLENCKRVNQLLPENMRLEELSLSEIVGEQTIAKKNQT